MAEKFGLYECRQLLQSAQFLLYRIMHTANNKE